MLPRAPTRGEASAHPGVLQLHQELTAERKDLLQQLEHKAMGELIPMGETAAAAAAEVATVAINTDAGHEAVTADVMATSASSTTSSSTTR